MELLCDPMKDRVVNGVKAPPHKPLLDSLMWKDGKSKLLNQCFT